MRYPVKVQPLPWYGGKQKRGKAEWICSLLPWEKRGVYVEPFGGMATVMARRRPVEVEIYNDIDGRAVNWWRIIRERRDEFNELLRYTPHSREEYRRAQGLLYDKDDLLRAWAFHVVISQSMMAQPEFYPESWQTTFNGAVKISSRWKDNRVDKIADRFRKVQFENVDAVDLLARSASVDNAVVYCDPPYRTARTDGYKEGDVQVDKLTQVLVGQRGRVAISGYDGEWDHLSWQRHDLESKMVMGHGETPVNEPRTEVLWTNYDAHSEQAIGGLFA